MSGKDKVVIELHPYINQTWRNNPGLHGVEAGRQAAKDHKVPTLGDKHIVLKIPLGIQMDESFLKGLLGPLARKVGPENLTVSVDGGYQGQSYDRRYSWRPRPPSCKDLVEEYLISEGRRIKERAAKKKKEAKNGDWSDPITFFVPDIGTRVRLEDDWQFRLHCEYRNSGLTEQLPGIYKDGNPWNWRRRSLEKSDVVIEKGAILTVNRVYIRQGAKEYSSITFNIKKGATVLTSKGKVELRKGTRFWAKLRDVNQMQVVVDRNTLAEN